MERKAGQPEVKGVVCHARAWTQFCGSREARAGPESAGDKKPSLCPTRENWRPLQRGFRRLLYRRGNQMTVLCGRGRHLEKWKGRKTKITPSDTKSERKGGRQGGSKRKRRE